jgi:hypothetical protein
MPGVVFAEGRDSKDGEDVKDQEQEHDNVGDRAEAFDKAHDDDLKLFHFADQLQQTHQTKQTEEGDIATDGGGGQPANNDKPEVEVIPGRLRAEPLNLYGDRETRKYFTFIKSVIKTMT